SVLGMSPAVLTETIWKLAQEKPSSLPSRVVVLTTAEGARQVREKLLAPSAAFGGQRVWAALRATLGRPAVRLPEPDICVFKNRAETSRELADIVTPGDNIIVADTILEELRKFTENPDCRVIASIAGGRKTMGALLYACMTLIGRETDRITHVLVPPPYDRPDHRPTFFFPGQPNHLKSQISNLKSQITLADIPFVPLRNRFAELGRMPGNFSRLAAHYSRQLKARGSAEVSLDEQALAATVNGTPVKLRRRAFQALRFLLEINREKSIPRGQPEAIAPLKDFLGGDGGWVNDQDDLKRELAEIRARFDRAGVAWKPGLRERSLILPPFLLVP
ncbi:MAG: CRISPR-associated ring nuclease Csm6, partial [Lentisphaerota bacterium]